MKSKAAIIVASCVFLLLAGCGGVTNQILNQLNPFAGTYSGTVVYTATNTSEPMTLNVGGNGHVTGTFTDPVQGIGSLSGNVDSSGNVSGTTLINTTPGTFSFAISSGQNNTLTGTGSFTQNANVQQVTLSVTKN